MRGLLLLLGVGAAVYTLLVITHDALPGGNDTLSGQTQSYHPVGERLSSWDSYLVPSPSRNPQMAISQGSAPLPPQLGDDASQSSKRKPGTEHQPATSEDKTPASLSVGAEPEPVEWAKVMLAAQTHSEASVSSPTIRFYSPGSKLQVVRREGAWFEVSDPVTQQRGWVLDQYLSSIASPIPTQVATESTTESSAKPQLTSTAEPQLTKPALPKVKNSHHQSAKPAVRGRVVVANADPWNDQGARRAHPRRQFGLIMFHPFGSWAQGR
jgi:hypothetical protein